MNLFCPRIPAGMDLRHKGEGDLFGIIGAVMAIRQLLCVVPWELLHDHIGSIGEWDRMVKIIILSLPGVALQRCGVFVRPAIHVPIPADRQQLV